MSSSLHALPTRPRLGGTLSGQAHAVMNSRIAGAQALPCCRAEQHALIAERSRLPPPAWLPPPRDGGSAKVQCSAHSHSVCALAPAIALPRCNASEVRRLPPRCYPASQPQRPSPPCQVAQALQPFFHRMAAEFPLKTEADDAVAPLRLRDRDDDRAEGGGRKREGGGACFRNDLAAAQGSSNRQEWQEEGEDGGVTGEGDDVMMMRGCDDVNCTLRILFASCVGVVFSQRGCSSAFNPDIEYFLFRFEITWPWIADGEMHFHQRLTLKRSSLGGTPASEKE